VLAGAAFTDEMRQRFADMASDIIASQIEAALRPKLDEIAAAATRSLDTEALRQLAEAMSRTAIERAGLIEVADRLCQAALPLRRWCPPCLVGS
jgi:hypothetical protein